MVRDFKHEAVVSRQKTELCISGAVTCECSRKIKHIETYRCLYCQLWFCDSCAEGHFGMTIKEYHGSE